MASKLFNTFVTNEKGISTVSCSNNPSKNYLHNLLFMDVYLNKGRMIISAKLISIISAIIVCVVNNFSRQ